MPPPRRQRELKYPPAEHELTDQEVRERFGSIIDDFLSALREDPDYLADVVGRMVGKLDGRQARRDTIRRKAEEEAASGRV